MPKREKPKPNKTRNDNRKNGKASKRKGARRHSSVVLTEVEQALLGKGRVHKMKHVSTTNWRGVENFKEHFNKEQAEKNKILYPWLFQGVH